MTDTPEIKFQPGVVVATIGAVHVADNHAILELHRRHLSGNWGDISKEDAKANDYALKCGARVLSSSKLPSGEKLWLLTEAECSATVLTPGEY